MSGLDRAFIKAYTKRHQPAGAISASHLPHAPQVNRDSAPAPARPRAKAAADVELPASPSYVIFDEAHSTMPAPHWFNAPTAPPQASGTTTATTPLATMMEADWAGPAFEAEQFGWTSPITDLVARTGADLDALAHKILSASRGGGQVIAIASAEPLAGGTTLLLCLAQRLAAMKLRAALVDADFASPALAEQLGMQPSFGWEDMAEHGRSLSDVLIESVEDGLALLPLRGPVATPQRLTDDLYWRTTIDALRARYRLVLIDLGSLESAEGAELPWLRAGCGIDAAIVVGRDGETGRHLLTSAVHHLHACNLDVLGVVENYCQSEAERLARHRPRVALAGSET